MRLLWTMQRAVWAICLIAMPSIADIAGIRASIQAGKFAEAIAACDRELESSPANVPILTLKGLALRASGEAAAGLAVFRKAIAAAPFYLPALQAAAQIEFEARDHNARKTLESIAKLAPANETAQAMLAELAFESRDCSRAVKHFSKIPASSRPPLARWHNGVCLFELERWREAAAEFTALLALREHPPTRFNLALSHWRAKDPAATLAALAPIAGPGADADTLSLQAAALRERREIPRAIEVLQRAVAAYPRDERLLLDLAVLCLDQNAVEIGIAVIEAGLKNIPGSVRLLTALGVFHVRAGRLEKADEYFLAVERLSPESGMGQVGVAMAMMQLGLPEDAIRRLRAVAAPSPMVSLTLARAILQNNPSARERLEAGNLLSTVIAAQPANAAAHSLLGKTLVQDGAVAKAMEALETALRLDPADRTAAYQLMLLYRRAGRAAQAARLNEKVRELLAKEKTERLEAQRYQLFRSAEH
ncbi:MAG: tetratricopeptide repeat protein [Bryobacteraceae bacterium]